MWLSCVVILNAISPTGDPLKGHVIIYLPLIADSSLPQPKRVYKSCGDTCSINPKLKKSVLTADPRRLKWRNVSSCLMHWELAYWSWATWTAWGPICSSVLWDGNKHLTSWSLMASWATRSSVTRSPALNSCGGWLLYISPAEFTPLMPYDFLFFLPTIGLSSFLF